MASDPQKRVYFDTNILYRWVRKLNAALLRTPVHGARLPAMVLSLSDVEAPAKKK